MKKFCGQSLCVCRRAPQIFIKFDFFFDTRFGGHGLKDCSRVTEHRAVALKVSRFYCQDFFGWSHESYRLHVWRVFRVKIKN